MWHFYKVVCILLTFITVSASQTRQYAVDLAAKSRRFDGIGGLSGGGATSKLLVNYPDKQLGEILDFLFKPGFGASLHMLKVEIGGDDQSSEGTESSHQHNAWEDPDFSRGYEWWLMREAKKRNPAILLYGLPWSWPGWIGGGVNDPYIHPEVAASYIVTWVVGAKEHHNLTIDYIGIWNEKPYDVNYIKILRRALDAAGMSETRVVAADGSWFVVKDILKDRDLAKAVDYIGVHYPGTKSDEEAERTGKQLWSSEDYSTYNDNVGAGCLARIINQNFVNGNMTSTIIWNLITSYYDHLAFDRDSLMTAQQPWSGHYDVNNTIWVAAHTTQFTSPGWSYLLQGSGSGHLTSGGSYVTLVSPSGNDVTIVIETVQRDHSKCVRPFLPPYSVKPQNATFHLSGTGVTQLNLWVTRLGFDGSPTEAFLQEKPVKVVGGTFTIFLDVDMVVTLTSLTSGSKGSYGTPPPAAPFPLPYTDDFERYPEQQEAYNLAQQIGVFEVRRDAPTRNQVLTQVVLSRPIHWCMFPTTTPLTLIGNFSWTNIKVSASVRIPAVNGSEGAFIAARVNKAGCNVLFAEGLYLWILPAHNNIVLSTDINRQKVIFWDVSQLKPDTWYNMTLTLQDNKVSCHLNGQGIISNFPLPSSVPPSGFVGVGTADFGYASFDNLEINSPS